MVEKIINEMKYITLFEQFSNKDIAEAKDADTIKQFMPLLSKIGKDWGKDSDVYSEVEDVLVSGNIKRLQSVLVNYDVWDDYKKQYAKLN
jgi:hypothetical protein